MQSSRSHPATRAAAVLLLLCLGSPAQNELWHHNGSTGFVSRGSVPGTLTAPVLQRIPGDQACAGSAIHSVHAVIQDQECNTVEPYFVEIRANDPAGPPTGAPGALIAAPGPFSLPATPGIGAFLVTLSFATPIGLPAAHGVPAGDVYIGIRIPANVLWPADGLSLHVSTTERMRPTAVGYTGLPGVAGLAWAQTAAGGWANADNRAWNVRTRFVEDVVQPFARLPANASRDFGYAGIFPDTANGELFGWRVRATAPVGSVTLLLAGLAPLPTPVVVPSIGVLCLDPSAGLVVLGTALTGAAAGQPATTSEATFGDFASVLAGNVYAQAITIAAGPIVRLSTMCRTSF